MIADPAKMKTFLPAGQYQIGEEAFCGDLVQLRSALAYGNKSDLDRQRTRLRGASSTATLYRWEVRSIYDLGRTRRPRELVGPARCIGHAGLA